MFTIKGLLRHSILFVSMLFASQGQSQSCVTGPITTHEGAANMIRFLYFLLSGPPAPTGVKADCPSAPESGFLDIIKEVAGASGIGGELVKAGYKTCSDIPNTGSVNADSYAVSFASATKKIPSGWTNADQSFDKRITVNENGTNVLIAELSCATSDITGYLRLKGEGMGENIEIETYYQYNSSTNLVRVDMYFNNTNSKGGKEKIASRFTTLDGDEYIIHMIRTTFELDGAGSGQGGIQAAVHGKRSLQTSEIKLLQDQTNATSSLISSGNEFCVDLSKSAEAAAGSCSSLSIEDPTAPLVSGTGTPAFSIQWVYNNMTLSPL